MCRREKEREGEGGMEIRLEKEDRSESASYKTFEKYWTSLLAIWLKCIPCPSLTSLPPVSLPPYPSTLSSLLCLAVPLPFYMEIIKYSLSVCVLCGANHEAVKHASCVMSHTHTHMRYHCITHLYNHKVSLCMCVCTCRNLCVENNKWNVEFSLVAVAALLAIIARDDRNKRKLKFSCLP